MMHEGLVAHTYSVLADSRHLTGTISFKLCYDELHIE